jgi:FtsH-binding integral membrane protein
VPYGHEYGNSRRDDRYARSRGDGSSRAHELAYERDHARPALSEARVAFIRNTYAHLAGAILAFVGLEALLLALVPPQAFLWMFSSGITWLFVLAAFMGASWVAQLWARSETSAGMQYAGLGLYVLAEAVIFLPLLYIATHYFDDPNLIPTAGILTLGVFGGLTATVFLSRKDFSPLYPFLSVGALVALGLIVAACIFGFSLGLFFCFAMVALLGGFILAQTSSVLHHFRTDMHVAAALMLFSSIATLFWYILQILMTLNRR